MDEAEGEDDIRIETAPADLEGVPASCKEVPEEIIWDPTIQTVLMDEDEDEPEEVDKMGHEVEVFHIQ